MKHNSINLFSSFVRKNVLCALAFAPALFACDSGEGAVAEVTADAELTEAERLDLEVAQDGPFDPNGLQAPLPNTTSENSYEIGEDGGAYPTEGHSIYFIVNGPTIVVQDNQCQVAQNSMGERFVKCFDNPFDRLQCTDCGSCTRTHGLQGSIHCTGACGGFSSCALFDVGPSTYQGWMPIEP